MQRLQLIRRQLTSNKAYKMEDDQNYLKIRNTVQEILDKSFIKNNLTLHEVEHVLPNKAVSRKFYIEGRVSKKLLKNLQYGWLSELDRVEDEVYDAICLYTGPRAATELFEDYWMVSTGASKNDKFVSLKVFNLDKTKEMITHKEDETLVIDIWATWCPYCQVPMEHNIQLMKKKEICDNNIKIIGI